MTIEMNSPEFMPNLLLLLIREYDSGNIELDQVESLMAAWTGSYLEALKEKRNYGHPCGYA